MHGNQLHSPTFSCPEARPRTALPAPISGARGAPAGPFPLERLSCSIPGQMGAATSRLPTPAADPSGLTSRHPLLARVRRFVMVVALRYEVGYAWQEPDEQPFDFFRLLRA